MFSKEIAKELTGKACDVKDFEITEISVDSRSVTKPETALFFALKGNTRDGHDYIPALYGRGVRNFVVSEAFPPVEDMEDANFFRV